MPNPVGRGVAIMESGARGVTGVSDDIFINANGAPQAFYLDVTAVSGGTPSMTVTLQAKDVVSGKYFALTPAFAAKTGTGSERIVILNMTDTVIRASYAITGTTPSFTFTVSTTAESI